jgi:hypothetical protein
VEDITDAHRDDQTTLRVYDGPYAMSVVDAVDGAPGSLPNDGEVIADERPVA